VHCWRAQHNTLSLIPILELFDISWNCVHSPLHVSVEWDFKQLTHWLRLCIRELKNVLNYRLVITGPGSGMHVPMLTGNCSRELKTKKSGMPRIRNHRTIAYHRTRKTRELAWDVYWWSLWSWRHHVKMALWKVYCVQQQHVSQSLLYRATMSLYTLYVYEYDNVGGYQMKNMFNDALNCFDTAQCHCQCDRDRRQIVSTAFACNASGVRDVQNKNN